MVLRDRRTVFMSIVLPLLVMPIMLLAGHASERRRERKLESLTYQYALAGSQAESLRALLGPRLQAARTAGSGPGAAEKETPFLARERQVADPAKSLDKDELQLYLEAQSAEEAKARAAAEETKARAAAEEARRKGERQEPDKGEDAPERDRAETVVAGAPVVTIVFRADRDTSQTAARRMRDLLRDLRRERRALVLKERGLGVDPAAIASVDQVDVATAAQVSGLQLGRFLTLFLVMFILSGGAVVATDSLAGEKERGTLETLLTTAASRAEIVAAKHLLILFVALLITLIQVANLLVYVGFKLIKVSAGFSVAISPALALLLFVLYLPVVALAASALLLTSGYAKSYKEAQLTFFPLFLLGMVPCLAPLLPGVPLRSAIALVPVANIAVGVKEVLTGVFDWPLLAGAWLVNAAAAGLLARAAARTLSNERLITAAETDAAQLYGGPALFPRHVLRWFAVVWAVIFAAGANMGEGVDIRVQLLVNLVVVFAGASFLMIRKYRLDPREALALRPVKPVVWLAVLIGAPAGLLAAMGVFRLANLVFPMPEKLFEAFGRALAPESIPFWETLLWLTVLPGICEEVAFRGVLLHGLRRRLHPVALALVVGLIFGFFHTALFRILPTGFLGVLLAAVTLLTGSIFPAMAWHAINNCAGLLAGHYGWSLADLGPGLYLAGAAVLLLAFWIIWRNRTPYPGLRPWRGKAGLRP
ncbi:MAG: CPBP family glutamic-type intramembrane protease [Acidobacteriota bacterium]